MIRNRLCNHGTGANHGVHPDVCKDDGALPDPGIFANGYALPNSCLLADGNIKTSNAMLLAAVDDRDLRAQQHVVFQCHVANTAVQANEDAVAHFGSGVREYASEANAAIGAASGKAP